MSVIKCKMCGGDLELIEGSSVAVCEYCGSQQTVPAADNEKKLTLFARANRLRLACEFDKAAGVYESIVADFPTEAEAYWGLVLCRYGIEYVDDPATGKKIPTCHRSSFDSVMEDSDFEQALENADAVARRVYRDEAKAIEELRRGIVEVSGKEPPYDIFICYKETAEDGQRTVDSVIAQDVYDALTEKGYRVFFSRISLEDKLGTEYEPYIFAALHSAKIMLAFGTDYEYYNAVWVKNEWSRYLQLMTKDKSKHLIPCYKGIDAYDMPKEFAKLQAQDMGKVGAMQDLLRGVDKIMSGNSSAAAQPPQAATNATAESLLKRAQMFLEDKDSKLATEYAQKVLDIDPECADAYMVLLLATWGIGTWEEAGSNIIKVVQSREYKRARQFASGALADKLADAERLANEHAERLEQEEKQRIEEANRRREYLSKKLPVYYHCHAPRMIAVGDAHTVGLKSDGTVVACGSNINGQCNVSGWTDIVEIAASDYHTVGLRFDGTVVACGDNKNGQCDVSGWTDVVAVSAGYGHVVGLKSDGTVVACGDNENGQCDVSEWTDIVAVAASYEHTVGLKSDGTVVACGSNSDGQCDVSDWTGIVAVAAGGLHTVGLKSDGTVVACGSNFYGACNVSGWTDIVAVAAGDSHTVGLKSDGTVVARGKNKDGQCDVSEWTGIVAVAAEAHTVGLKSDGTVVACGSNSDGQCDVSDWKLFDNFDDVVNRAVAEANRRREGAARRQEEEARRQEEEARRREYLSKKLSVYHHCHASSAIAAGDEHTVGLKSDGTVVACGKNEYGQCDVSEWTDIVAVAASDNHTVGLISDGTVVACGYNKYGKCDVSGWTDIVAVAAGADHTVGLKSDGTVVACGSNINGQCNVSGWTDIVAVAISYKHTVGLKSDGTVVACGYNKFGQCDVSGWTDIVAVAAGADHTVGLKSDGTVVACGHKAYCNVSGWTDVVAVAADMGHTVGLISDGTVVACGYNEYGQCDVSGWTDIVAVAAGDDHTVGLKSDGMVVACGSNSDGRCAVSGWKLFDNFDDVVNRAVAEAEKQRLDRIAALEAEKQRIETELPHIKGLFTGKRRKEIENRLAEIEIELKRLTE